MIRLLFFINVTGIIFYVLQAILLPFKKISLPPGYRIFICRLNMLFFIIPFPLLLPYIRRYFKDFIIKIPFDPSLKNGSHITVNLANDVCIMLPKPNVLQILFLLVWMIVSIRLFIKYTHDQNKLNGFHSSFDLFMDEMLINDSIDATELVHMAMDELNIKKKIHIYTLENLFVPHVSGIFHLRLCLPLYWDVSEQVYYMAIKHELAHIIHKDLLFQRLGFIACSIHCYNPIVHILTSRINNYDELHADECACSRTSKQERISYANAIIDLSEIISNAHNMFYKGLGTKRNSKSFIEERVMLIVKNDYCKSRPIKLIYATIISLLIFIISAIPAMSYNLPAAMTSQTLATDSIDMLDVDILPLQNNTNPLYGVSHPSENELYTLLDNLDFSDKDAYCVDKNENIFDISPPSYTECNHSFEPVKIIRHIKNKNGSCIIQVFNGSRCTKCYIVDYKDLYTTTKFEKCYH